MATKTLLVPQPKPIKSLAELCLIFFSRRLHYEQIKKSLFLLPDLCITGIKNQLSSLSLSCRFTDTVIKSALDKDWDSLPNSSWTNWCLESVKKLEFIEKLAFVTFNDSKLAEWSTSKDFAVTEKELSCLPQAVGTCDYMSGSSLVFEGKKYIIFTSHPQMVFGELLDPNYDDDINATNSNSFCIVASLKINQGQMVYLVAISKILKGKLVPIIVSEQKMTEEMRNECQYLAEYFGYLRGESPDQASSAFV